MDDNQSDGTGLVPGRPRTQAGEWALDMPQRSRLPA